jgi:lipopolysaccharide transport system ATP-binding protein
MSRDPVISVRGLGKRYRLGQLTGGYQLLTERLAARFAQLRRGEQPEPADEFWALREIDFEVERGETFGIIGHNGAGKSTLLKILARVTPPTVGEADLRGRVGALLEVGTGFHLELTGRENVYLNGAILGMSREEINRKFDEIVEFADVGRFIDTPVKRYSSGMQLRLAFSVAAHLEPEVLIIDEVLSVGDLAFQRKCLGRMETVAGEGRTVIFVSHNLSAVENLCPRSMLLSGGRIVTQGTTRGVVEEYVKQVGATARTHLGDREDRDGSGALRFLDLQFESGGRVIDTPAAGQDFDLVISYETADGKPLRNVNFTIAVLTQLGEMMLHLSTEARGTIIGEIPAAGSVRCRVPRCPLPTGQYLINLWSDIGGQPLDWVQHASELTVSQGDFYGSGREPPESHRAVMIDHQWSVDSEVPTGEAVAADLAPRG